MKVHGHRVLVRKPEPPKPKMGITLSDKDNADIDKEMMSKYTKLEVTHVGDDVTKVAVGDLVYIGDALKHSELIQIEDDFFFMVGERDVAITWRDESKS